MAPEDTADELPQSWGRDTSWKMAGHMEMLLVEKDSGDPISVCQN